MTKTDMQKLSNLLDALFASYPKEKRPSGNDDIFLAYLLALEPYEYGTVRTAVLDHARDNRMFPSVAEIVAKMPKERKHCDRREMRKYIEKLIKETEEAR